jgi:hypothetical protein
VEEQVDLPPGITDSDSMNELFMQKMMQKEEKNAYGQEVSRYIGTFIKFSITCK